MEVDRQGMIVLDAAACAALLGTTRLGRIALTQQALPVILPVAFGLLDDGLVFNTGPGLLQRAAQEEQVACFEADWADEDFNDAWSVWAIGRLSALSHPGDVRRAQELDLSLWPAVDGEFVRLAPQIFSGRRRAGVPPRRQT